MVTGAFVLHEEIATFGATDVEHFVIDGRHFIAIANEGDLGQACWQGCSTRHLALVVLGCSPRHGADVGGGAGLQAVGHGRIRPASGPAMAIGVVPTYA